MADPDVTAFAVGPCEPWTTAALMEAGCLASLDTVDSDLADQTALMAGEVLFALSGLQFPGVCEATVRPCRMVQGVTPPGWWVAQWGYGAFGYCSCRPYTHRSCDCPSADEVRLAGFPVTSIQQVLLDGAVVDPDRYVIADEQYLTRIDGETWPCCQDLGGDPQHDENTWEVTYTYGRPIPEAGKVAALTLACELYRALAGEECNLPERIQSITRQGVSVAILDPMSFLDEGKTGLYVVDLFLKAYNPKGRRRRGHIASPDVGSHRSLR